MSTSGQRLELVHQYTKGNPASRFPPIELWTPSIRFEVSCVPQQCDQTRQPAYARATTRRPCPPTTPTSSLPTRKAGKALCRALLFEEQLCAIPCRIAACLGRGTLPPWRCLGGPWARWPGLGTGERGGEPAEPKSCMHPPSRLIPPCTHVACSVGAPWSHEEEQ
jgi:hypothetical protein